jgi:hypothetical protein
MADAIDREHHTIGLARQTCQQIQVVLDTTVVMQECGAWPLRDRTELSPMAILAGSLAQVDRRVSPA